MNQLLNKTTMVAALLRSVPVAMTIIFIIAVVLMNFLARITLVSLPFGACRMTRGGIEPPLPA